MLTWRGTSVLAVSEKLPYYHNMNVCKYYCIIQFVYVYWITKLDYRLAVDKYANWNV